jgi:ABC-2 type transport system permease protein
MIARLRRGWVITRAVAAMAPKIYLAYNIWFWVEFFSQILAMVIFVYFWRAVYADQATISGLTLNQTLNYILLAQIILPVVVTRLILEIGFQLREGRISIELLRPIDLQARYYIENIAFMSINLIVKTPLLVIAWYFFGLQLPSQPAIWMAFFLTLYLGYAVIFFFDWIFASLAFYTTEVWGLNVVRDGVALFFSGALVPLSMLPAWLQALASAMPFAQALYVPVSILSGITPLEQVPNLLLIQIAWIIGLGVVSRIIFNLALRKVTVQGG